MFKEIFSRLIAVIFRPSETWESLRRKEENTETFLSRFVYPLFGLIALSAFLGVLFTRKEFDFQIALKSSIKILVASMGGFFLGTHLLNELWYKVFKYPRDIKLIQRFVGYSSSLMFVLLILLALLPEFIFLWMFILYTFYIVWMGAHPYMKVKEEEQMKFTILASVIIVGTPFLIDRLLFLLMPGLRF